MADPKIRYDVTAHTEGQGEVDRLATSLERLDEAIDPAGAARARELATEIQRLGDQQAAIGRFAELGAAVDKARGDMLAADAAVAALTAEIQASGTPTAAQAGRLEKLGTAAQAARGDLAAQTAALEASRGRLAALGIDSAKAAEAEEALAAATRATRAELASLGTALAGVNARGLVEELRELGAQQAAVQEFRELGTAAERAQAGLRAAEQAAEAYRAKLAGIEAPTAAQISQQQRLGFAVEDARTKLAGQTAAVEAAGARLRTLGIETGDLAASEERLRTATQGTVAEIQALGQQQAAVTRFQELGAATERARLALASTDATIADFRAGMASAEAPTAGEAAQLAKLADASALARQALDRQTAALDVARAAVVAARGEEAALAVETQRTAAAAGQMATAWQALGASGFAALQTEAQRTRAALEALRTSGRDPVEIRVEVAATEARLRELDARLAALRGSAAGAGQAIGQGVGAATPALVDLAAAAQRTRAAIAAAGGSVEDFRDDLAALKALGSAIDPATATRAEQLSAALRDLGQQQGAAARFAELRQQSATAAAALAEAQAAAQAYALEITASGAPTEAQAAKLAALTSAVRAADQAQTLYAEALSAARGRLSALGVSTDDLAQTQAALRASIAATVAEVRALGDQTGPAQRFAELSAATEKARLDLVAANLALANYQATLGKSGPATAGQTAELTRLSTAASSARTAFFATEGALDAARAAMAATQGQAAALAAETTRTTAAADRMAAAWSTLGVRSFTEVRVEAEKVRAALLQVQATSRNPAEIQIATAAAQAKLEALGVELGGLQRAAESAGAGMSAGFLGSIAAIAAATAGVEAFKKILDTGLQETKLSAQLKSVFGDADRVNGALGFVGETAFDLGQRLDSTGSSFAKLAASAMGTSLEGQKTRDVFTGVSEAATALKLSGDDVNGVLLAVGQSMSKGTIQSEELKGQIGERLPGAFGIAARAMGVTTAELGKMLEAGTVMSDDFLPKFAAELHRTFGPGAQEAARGLDSEFNRLVNTLSLFAREIADSGLMESVTTQVRAMAQALRDGLDSGELQERAAAIGRALSGLVDFLGSAARWAMEFGDALLTVGKILAEGALIQIGLSRLASSLGLVGTAGKSAAAGVAAVGAASAGAAAGIAATGTAAAGAGAAAAASATQVGLLGSALRLLPAGIAIALAVEGLPAAGRAIGEFAARMAGVDDDLAAAHQRRIVELDGEVEALKDGAAAQAQYAGLALKSRADLVAMTEQSRAAYAAEVQAAIDASAAAVQYANRQKERVEQEKEVARLRGASAEELASLGRQERAYAAEAQKATDRQAELRQELTLTQKVVADVADGIKNGLTPAASELARTLSAAIKPGADLEDTLKKIGKAADLRDVAGIQAFGLALRKLVDDGKLAPEAARKAWSEALGKISGEDLQKFRAQAGAAFDDSARGAAALADTVEAQTRAAFRGLKLDFDQFTTGLSSGTRNAVADLDVIAASADKVGAKGTQAGDALRKGLAGAISGARTAEDLDLLGQRLDEFEAKGKIAAGQARILGLEIETARLRLGPLGEAAKAAGVDVGALAAGISTGFAAGAVRVQALVEEIDRAGIAADRASPLLAAALNQQIAAAKTKEEIALVRDTIDQATASGKLFGRDATAALEQVRVKALQLSPAFRDAQDAAGRLGVQLRDKLIEAAQQGAEGALTAYGKMQSGGQASAREINTAFANMAAEVVRKSQTTAGEVIDANGNMSVQVVKQTAAIVPEWLKVEAATRGAVIEVDAFGGVVVRAAAAGEQAGSVISKGFEQAAASIGAASDELDVFSAKAIAARNKADLSVLGKSGQIFDASGKPTGNGLIEANGQLTIPDGYSFDQQAFQRAANLAMQSGRTAPDPKNFVKPGGLSSGSLVGGGGGLTPEVAARLKAIENGSANVFTPATPAPAPARAPAPAPVRAPTPAPTPAPAPRAAPAPAPVVVTAPAPAPVSVSVSTPASSSPTVVPVPIPAPAPVVVQVPTPAAPSPEMSAAARAFAEVIAQAKGADDLNRARSGFWQVQAQGAISEVDASRLETLFWSKFAPLVEGSAKQVSEADFLRAGVVTAADASGLQHQQVVTAEAERAGIVTSADATAILKQIADKLAALSIPAPVAAPVSVSVTVPPTTAPSPAPVPAPAPVSVTFSPPAPAPAPEPEPASEPAPVIVPPPPITYQPAPVPAPSPVFAPALAPAFIPVPAPAAAPAAAPLDTAALVSALSGVLSNAVAQATGVATYQQERMFAALQGQLAALVPAVRPPAPVAPPAPVVLPPPPVPAPAAAPVPAALSAALIEQARAFRAVEERLADLVEAQRAALAPAAALPVVAAPAPAPALPPAPPAPAPIVVPVPVPVPAPATTPPVPAPVAPPIVLPAPPPVVVPPAPPLPAPPPAPAVTLTMPPELSGALLEQSRLLADLTAQVAALVEAQRAAAAPPPPPPAPVEAAPAPVIVPAPAPEPVAPPVVVLPPAPVAPPAEPPPVVVTVEAPPAPAPVVVPPVVLPPPDPAPVSVDVAAPPVPASETAAGPVLAQLIDAQFVALRDAASTEAPPAEAPAPAPVSVEVTAPPVPAAPVVPPLPAPAPAPAPVPPPAPVVVQVAAPVPAPPPAPVPAPPLPAVPVPAPAPAVPAPVVVEVPVALPAVPPAAPVIVPVPVPVPLPPVAPAPSPVVVQAAAPPPAAPAPAAPALQQAAPAPAGSPVVVVTPAAPVPPPAPAPPAPPAPVPPPPVLMPPPAPAASPVLVPVPVPAPPAAAAAAPAQAPPPVGPIVIDVPAPVAAPVPAPQPAPPPPVPTPAPVPVPPAPPPEVQPVRVEVIQPPPDQAPQPTPQPERDEAAPAPERPAPPPPVEAPPAPPPGDRTADVLVAAGQLVEALQAATAAQREAIALRGSPPLAPDGDAPASPVVPPQVAQRAQRAAPPSVHRVEIALNGRTTVVPVASESAGVTLVGFVRELEQSARSAGVRV